MNNALVLSSILLWVVVLFNLLLTLGLVRRISATPVMSQLDVLEVGEPAPDFMADTLNGDSVTLAQFQGQALALVFMSPTCSPCVEKIPELKSLASRMEYRGISFVLVFKQSAEEIKDFVEQYQLAMSIWIAPAPNPFWQDYKVSGTPFYCLVNTNQIIFATGFHNSMLESFIKEEVSL